MLQVEKLSLSQQQAALTACPRLAGMHVHTESQAALHAECSTSATRSQGGMMASLWGPLETGDDGVLRGVGRSPP